LPASLTLDGDTLGVASTSRSHRHRPLRAARFPEHSSHGRFQPTASLMRRLQTPLVVLLTPLGKPALSRSPRTFPQVDHQTTLFPSPGCLPSMSPLRPIADLRPFLVSRAPTDAPSNVCHYEVSFRHVFTHTGRALDPSTLPAIHRSVWASCRPSTSAVERSTSTPSSRPNSVAGCSSKLLLDG
jgi:hypothetical protein